MLIASYNSSQMGDVLIVMLHEDMKNQKVEIKDNVVQISDADGNTKLGYNFFGLGEALGIKGSGQIKLDEQQIKLLNEVLKNAGFELLLEVDKSVDFVVGLVEEMVEHPDSDHLHITKTNIGNETLQIVCGASNIAEGQLVVVAKVGAMMPNGAIIWPGQLRGIKSDGMICSARELNLPNAPKKSGILVLSKDDFQKGQPFLLA
ncbi:YtpR family tRNA-binding protein [Liquorilactobacillus cacaonum]|uniref:tRNA-binding domain-containing protein n=1 Tax=Liquorilactobacillus cacaonum DSM 21116 TaxID=1423729 RepID=A0A0R2CFY6_9LACO|nr:DUF4479 and tRNA-binding domain-containing protein [Liquorilactobacillus cacaonum]KRM90605.1 tRNA-binding domain-containing protein [Liquorilactobacillus cacaonum DSM 21116]